MSTSIQKKLKTKPPLEKVTQKEILDYLRFKRALVFKINNVGTYLKKKGGGEYFVPPIGKGISDIIGCSRRGQFLAIEVKRPGKKPTDEQRAFLDDVEARKGIALVAYSLDDVINTLDNIL